MRKALGTIGLLLLLIAGAAIWFGFFADYSEGFRVGQVIKLSHKGFLLKTWEGTLDQGFLKSGASPDDPGVATRLWDFSVSADEDQVRKDVDTALTEGGKVKLYYREKVFQFGWRGDTKYFVYKVEQLKN